MLTVLVGRCPQRPDGQLKARRGRSLPVADRLPVGILHKLHGPSQEKSQPAVEVWITCCISSWGWLVRIFFSSTGTASADDTLRWTDLHPHPSTGC